MKQCVAHVSPYRWMGLAIVAGCLLMVATAVTAAPPTQRITIGTFFPYYSPTIVHIGSGTPISWENPTYTLHSITHDGCVRQEKCAFDSGPIGPQHTFTVHHLPPGSYSYHCLFHPIMRGELIVAESGLPEET